MDEDDSYSYSDESRSPSESSDYDSSPSELEGARYYVTKESQNASEPSRKESYTGMRNLSDMDKIEEKDIVAPDGSVLGVKNRVRAGLANFEDREALLMVSVLQELERGWGWFYHFLPDCRKSKKRGE